MTNILEVNAIQTFINQFHILEGVSLTVPKGSITALLGRNGAGKTTTLRSIMGLTPPREGQIIFAGEEIQGKAAYDIAARGIGYVPEYRAIFRALTVEENLKIAERSKGDLARRGDLIFELFPDLKRFYRLPGGQLSGGQQQMLAIARALVPENRLLLVDEPSEGLAPIIIDAIVAALRHLGNALAHWKQYAAVRDAHYVPALYNRVGYVNVTELTEKVAADIEIARNWKPGSLQDDGRRAGSEKGFRQ